MAQSVLRWQKGGLQVLVGILAINEVSRWDRIRQLSAPDNCLEQFLGPCHLPQRLCQASRILQVFIRTARVIPVVQMCAGRCELRSGAGNAERTLMTQAFGRRSARDRLGTRMFSQANNRDDSKKAVHKSALERRV
jgi:hypothetical protein